MYTLRVLGTARVEASTGMTGERPTQPRALALLACLAAAGQHGCTRDKLVGLLWPERDSRHARHALSVQLHQIRRLLGRGALLTEGEFVRLNPDIVTADVAQFGEALRTGDLRLAAALYGGPFLAGFHLTGCADFERWIEDERQRLAVQCLDILESLARRAERDGAAVEAVGWWQRAAQHDPFNSRVALACARALATSGDRGNGVQFLREHAKRLQEDLEIEPDPEILDAIRTGDFGKPPTYANGTGGSGGWDDSKPVAEPVAPSPQSRQPSLAQAGAGDREATSGGNRKGEPHPRWKRSWRRRVAVPAAVTALALTGTMAVRARISGGYDPGRVAILPTRVVELDTAISTLVTAHLQAAVAGWDGLEAASATATEELWRTAGGTPRNAPSDASLRSIAAGLGAGLLLMSDAAPVSGGSIELHARLSDAADGALIASASVTGPAGSLRASAALALFQLIGRTQGISEDRIATFGTFDPSALQKYLEAHRVGGAERERLLREALADDSTFALAAVALLDETLETQNRLREEPWASVARAAWTHRQRLSPSDRALVEALVGWRFTPRYSAAQLVGAWERAVEIAPDRLQHLRGLALECYSWCSELSPDWTDRWKERVLEAHDALLDAGGAETDDLERGMEVAFLAGDTSRLRRYAELLPDRALYGRWLAATGLDRERDAERLRSLIEQDDFASMRVGNIAVLTGLGLEDAARLARLDRNSGAVHQLVAQVHARERGRHAEHRALRDKMFQLEYAAPWVEVFLAHSVVWEWAYFDEPEADSVLGRQERTLAGIIERQPSIGADTLALAHCALAQLRLGRGDTTGVARAVAFLSEDPDARDLAASRMCAPLLELLAVRGGSHDAIARAASRLNDVMQYRPLDRLNGAGMMNVEIMLAGAANLELARTYRALGYPESGLRAVVRRPYGAGMWALFGVHIDFLLEEARLLAAAGATEKALAKYYLYFRLRPEPPDLDSWRETWEAARAEREALRSADGG